MLEFARYSKKMWLDPTLLRGEGSKFRNAPPERKDLCEEHLIIYERQTSVFNPLTGMKIMKVRTSPVMDPRLKQSKPDLTVSHY